MTYHSQKGTEYLVSMRRNIDIFFLIASIVLKPINLFPSGMPQIADFTLMFGMFIYIIRYRGLTYIDRFISRHLIAILLILYYQITVNLSWYLIMDSTVFLRKTFYYIYNIFVYLYIIDIYLRHGEVCLKTNIAKACLYSSIVAELGVLTVSGQALRKVGFFNNPNQLGYYSLVIAAYAFTFIEKRSERNTVIILSIIMLIQSGSKASFIGYAVFIILYESYNSDKDNNFIRKLLSIMVIILSLYLVLYSDVPYFRDNVEIQNMRNRLNATESDDNLWAGRGYNRITEVGKHFLWGMGEGGYERFTTMDGVETHSAFANVYVSYGLIGLISYAYILYSSIRKEPIGSLAILSGILVYNISHNGVRNTLVWILLAYLYSRSIKDQLSVSNSRFERVKRDRYHRYHLF